MRRRGVSTAAAMSTAAEAARQLGGARRAGGGWLARCPVHDDREPSLSLRDGGGGRLLWHCYGGCSQERVAEALRAAGVLPSPSPNGRAPAREVRYEVRDAAGALVAVHVRQNVLGGKRLRWEQPDGTPGLNGRAVASLPLYGVEDLHVADPAAPVILVEGEPARDALTARGVLAVGTVCGAAATPGDDALRPLIGRPVLLWPDADEPGARHVERIAERLHALGHEDIRVVRWADAPPKGDAADFAGDADELHALLDAAAPWSPTGVQAGSPPADGCRLLDAVVALVRCHVVISAEQRDAVALWAAHTHAFDAADATPYLSITSPEKRSGKTRLLEVLEQIVARPWLTGRITPAVLARKVDAEAPTLLLDESDAAFKSDKEYAETLRGILNSGHRRGGSTSCCVGQGANISYRDFSTFGAKAIAGIGKLPDTVADRAIAIRLKRRAPHEVVARFRFREVKAKAKPLRDALARWATANVAALTDARPDIPVALDDRAADGWEPLLAIADLVAGDWPERARRAALVLSAGGAREDDSTGVRLLADVRELFKGNCMRSAVLATSLADLDAAPWGDWRGKPLDARGLARLLKPHGITPKKIRFGEATAQGYERADFEDAWTRYVCPSDHSDRNNRNIPYAEPKIDGLATGTQWRMFRLENIDFPLRESDVPDVPDKPSHAESEHDRNGWVEVPDEPAEVGREANDEVLF